MHISEKEKKNFQAGYMTTEETIAFLEHLDNCDFCLEQLVQEEEQHFTVTPAYLKEQILQTALSPEVQVTKAVRTTSHRMQTFYYSLRTALGVAAALFLLFSIDQVEFSPHPRSLDIKTEAPVTQRSGNRLYDLSQKVGQRLTGSTTAVTDYLNDFSSKLFNGGN